MPQLGLKISVINAQREIHNFLKNTEYEKGGLVIW